MFEMLPPWRRGDSTLRILWRPSATITSVTGVHQNGKTNDDVIGFDSHYEILNYFPQGLDKFFGNLKSIVIYYGRIKEIHQSDLKPFPNLVNLYLENNEIEYLEPGLFEFNPHLQGVSFLDNKVTKIDPTVFDSLPQLQNIWLNQNPCINLESTGSLEGAQTVIAEAKKLCSGQKDMEDSEKCSNDWRVTCEEQKALENLKCQLNFDYKIESLANRLVEKMEKICELENNLNITSPDSAAITSVTGKHNDERTNDDVVGFDSRHKCMNHFPQGLDKYFKMLLSIVIYYGGIKEIHQSDLKPFPYLVNLYLENNEIEYLEAGLFDFNPHLQGVSFLDNKITNMDGSVFDNLYTLKNIWLDNNMCINLNSTGTLEEAKKVIDQAKTLCSGIPMLGVDVISDEEDLIDSNEE
ncbi:leucine-rich repeat-containing protein 15-like [Chironomus tepperi]|uniref:leucine-rich repeat-containing protein 15-like n=1 Tax=Chironomus tepperi TaxID=113505 RepID=UPI00391F5FD4